MLRGDGDLNGIVAEVHNTYGERHCYFVRPDERGHTQVDKAFYVSPFFDVDGRYDMRIGEPGDHLDLAITLRRGADDHAAFTATVQGQRGAAPGPLGARRSAPTPVRRPARDRPDPSSGHPPVAPPRSDRPAARQSPRAVDPGGRRPMTAPLRSVPEIAPLIGGPWHHVGNPPDRKIHAAIARSLFPAPVASMPIRVQFPDGTIGVPAAATRRS